MGRVVVVGLGPAGPEQLTAAATSAIERIPRRFLRTTRHPAARAVEPAVSFDAVYESATSLDEVYAAIVDALVEAALAEAAVVDTEAGGAAVLYAVPGSPSVAERTVELLLADERVVVELVAGLSFTDLAWARLG
ncbi:MAG: tetrapyrrole methylase family protein / MazG family protein, partial [Actinomycetota bacterium]|nr:tetrapyrrole methylase family protein / MazG family protein [Actinomycetota bacterium]